MLNKVKIIMIVGLALQLIRTLVPQLEIPEDFNVAVEALINSLYIIIPVIFGWFRKESRAKLAKLQTKP